jgi:hypothetical protein
VILDQRVRALRRGHADLVPPTETIASRYATKWFLVHAAPEEAIAALHLGPPTGAKEKMGKGALNLRQGGAAGEGLLQPATSKHPLQRLSSVCASIPISPRRPTRLIPAANWLR